VDSQDAVRWMFHATAMVRDYELARDRLSDLFGLVVLEDTVVETPEVGRRGGMTWLGDNSLELGQPIVPGAGADRFVERFGPGLHSIALQVKDLDRTLKRAENLGIRTIARPSEYFAFSDPRDLGGVFIEWFAAEHDVDPHFGATIPVRTTSAAVSVSHVAHIGAVAADPIAMADKIATAAGREVTFSSQHSGPRQPVAGVDLGDCTLAIYPLDPETSDETWGRLYTRGRVHLMVLRISDLTTALSVLEDRGVRSLWAQDGTAVLDPVATGHVQVAVTDRFLPGDPRSSVDAAAREVHRQQLPYDFSEVAPWT